MGPGLGSAGTSCMASTAGQGQSQAPVGDSERGSHSKGQGPLRHAARARPLRTAKSSAPLCFRALGKRNWDVFLALFFG